MPMGELNEAPTYVAMTTKLQMEWDTLARERVLKNVASNIIVDDVWLSGHTEAHLLVYFRTVLDFFKHHCATLKLKKWKWFKERCEFLVMYLVAGGTQPAKPKNEDLPK